MEKKACYSTFSHLGEYATCVGTMFQNKNKQIKYFRPTKS